MGRTILLVDDETENIEPMAILLSPEYQVLIATSAEQAFSILKREPVELIIADQRMPGLTGIELLKRVKDLYPEIPRIILTAYTDFEVMLKAINEGSVYRYIIKPWAPDEMRTTIRQALEWKDLCTAKGELTAGLIESHRKLAQRNLDAQKALTVMLALEKCAMVGRLTSDQLEDMVANLQVLSRGLEDLAALCQLPPAQIEGLRGRCASLQGHLSVIQILAQGIRYPFTLSLIDPAEPAREVVSISQGNALFRDRELCVEMSPTPPWLLDKNQIRMALFHLLENAARASAPGEKIWLRIALENGQLVYRVTDRGPGIDPAEHERIFEPFYSTWGPERAGIGLFLCRQIADFHSGQLELSTEAGKGSSFALRLPPAVS